MPIAYLDVPPRIGEDAKKRLVEEIYAALDKAYRVPDTRIFLREWPHDMVSQDGRVEDEPNRPVMFLEVPPGITLERKRRMVEQISAAVTTAYNLHNVLIFLREYPLDMVSEDGGLQSENPTILEAMKQAEAV
jgi:phenylpyruvate tautomerase PptA (4-oxalocrotonate tautomerase family)